MFRFHVEFQQGSDVTYLEVHFCSVSMLLWQKKSHHWNMRLLKETYSHLREVWWRYETVTVVGFVAIVVVGNVLGIVMVVTIVRVRSWGIWTLGFLRPLSALLSCHCGASGCCVGCDRWLKSNETLPLKCRQFRTLRAIFLDLTSDLPDPVVWSSKHTVLALLCQPC